MREQTRFYPSGKQIFLLLAVLFHLAVYSFYLFPALFYTNSLTEPDDGYAYIHKANAFAHCHPLTDCPAYATLVNQARAASGLAPQMRDRFEGRLFCNYSALHSALLSGLRLFLPSWETAYAALVAIGGVLIAGAFGLLVYRIFGAAPAAVFFLFFTSIKYPGSGWQYVVPVNLSAALAAMAWFFGTVATRRARCAVIAFSVLSVFMHPLGLALGGVTFLLWLVQSRGSLRSAAPWLGGLVVALLAAKAAVASQQVSGIECAFGAHVGFDPVGTSVSFRSLGHWFLQQRGGYFSTGLFLALGVARAPRARREQVAVLLAGLLGLMIAAQLYVLPGYPGELSIRLLFPFGALASGAVAAGICSCVTFCLCRLRKKNISALSLLALVILAGLASDRFGMLKRGLFGSSDQWESLRFWQKCITRAPDYYLSGSQIKTLSDTVPPGGVIAYDEEQNIYHGLANGLIDRQAVFLPFLQPDAAALKGEGVDVYSLANPVAPKLLDSGSVTLNGTSAARGFTLKLENKSFSVATLSVTADGRPMELAVPARSDQWYPLPEIGGGRQLGIRLLSGANVVLKGVRLSDQNPGALQWPWDLGWSITHAGSVRRIESSGIDCQYGHHCQWPKEILNDDGAAVLVKRSVPRHGLR